MIFSCDNQNFIHISTNSVNFWDCQRVEPTFKKFYPDNSFSINLTKKFWETIHFLFPHHFFYLFFFLSRNSKLLSDWLNFLSHSDIPSTFYLSDSVSLPHIVSTLPKDLTCFLFGLCELRHCVHNIPKIISPADQNLLVLTANDKITWCLRPQTPIEKS